MAVHNELGKKGEEFVANWLMKNGYSVLHRNWCFGKWEIDIVAKKGGLLIIGEVKKAISIPVFGNGDITSVADGQRMLEETNVDGLMVGRGADGNPWIFRELAAALAGEEIPAPPTLEERLDLAREHLQMLIDFKGEYISVKEMRRHISAYLKGMPHAAEFRARFHKMNTQEDFVALIDEYQYTAEQYYENEGKYTKIHIQ